jgi:SAM-dependent methyltransferase
MTKSNILENVREYYTAKILEHGTTAQGVDWKSADSQILRFQQLLKLIHTSPCSINDYGCGYGALIDTLDAEGYQFTYSGLDLSDAMIARARELHGEKNYCSFTTNVQELPIADYTIASGIFNVKQGTTDGEWQSYVLDTITQMNAKSSKGFAFNVLTGYSDVEKRRADLYYADPLFYFDFCKRSFSKYVAVLHDYPLYEFTLLVRKLENS